MGLANLPRFSEFQMSNLGAGASDDVAWIEHGSSSSLTGFEANEDVLVEVGFASEWRLGDRDGPVFHIGEGFLVVANKSYD